MTSETVRLAAAMPDMNHREPAFLEMVREVKDGMLGVYEVGAEHFQAYLLGGSGTAAVEAMISSCVNSGPVLVLENGYYSSRLRQILEVHAIPHETLTFGWLDPWDMSRVEEVLMSQGFEAVLATHHETTSGRLNPVDELADLCWTYNTRLLVDAMSSFGADPIDLTGIDALCASSNKCLHGIPGVGLVLVKNDLARRLAAYPRRSYYLSLPMYEGDSPPITPPIPALAALRQALREMGPGGQPARRARMQAQADRIRATAAELGLQMSIPAEEASCTLTMLSFPASFEAEHWFTRNREAGFEVYACKGELYRRFFQVSTMGEVSDEQVDGWLDLLRSLV